MSVEEVPNRDAAIAGFEAAFGEGRFFDAHEILEQYWVAYRGRDRDFYRGLIQAAVALHHASSGNTTGATSVAARARANLAPYAPSHAGVDVAAMLEALSRVRADS
jgi:predicted metal-dependent hydrolase